MLEKIKLMICCLFNLQEEKNKKGSKGSPYGRKEWSKISSGFPQKAKYSRAI